jgi:hypothetical protein
MNFCPFSFSNFPTPSSTSDIVINGQTLHNTVGKNGKRVLFVDSKIFPQIIVILCGNGRIIKKFPLKLFTDFLNFFAVAVKKIFHGGHFHQFFIIFFFCC